MGAGGTGARPLAPIYGLLRCRFAALDKQQANAVLGAARATEGMVHGTVIALACGSVAFACFGLSRVKLRRLLVAGGVGSGSERNDGVRRFCTLLPDLGGRRTSTCFPLAGAACSRSDQAVSPSAKWHGSNWKFEMRHRTEAVIRRVTDEGAQDKLLALNKQSQPAVWRATNGRPYDSLVCCVNEEHEGGMNPAPTPLK